MQFDDFRFGKTGVLCDMCEVGAHLPAVEDGNFQDFARRQRREINLACERAEFLKELLIGEQAGIIVNHQRAVSRDGLNESRDMPRGEQELKCAYFLVDLFRDPVAEDSAHGAVSVYQKARK